MKHELRITEDCPQSHGQRSQQYGKVQLNVIWGRLAHGIEMRLKYVDKKFSGDLGDCWMDYVDDFLPASLDYNLSPP